jgi:hypothetical protein
MPKRIDNWSLTSLQQRLVKTGGRQIKHARYYYIAAAGRELSDAAAVCGDGAKGCRLAGGDGVDGGGACSEMKRPGSGGRRGVHGMQ